MGTQISELGPTNPHPSRETHLKGHGVACPQYAPHPPGTPRTPRALWRDPQGVPCQTPRSAYLSPREVKGPGENGARDRDASDMPIG